MKNKLWMGYSCAFNNFHKKYAENSDYIKALISVRSFLSLFFMEMICLKPYYLIYPIKVSKKHIFYGQQKVYAAMPYFRAFPDRKSAMVFWTVDFPIPTLEAICRTDIPGFFL